MKVELVYIVTFIVGCSPDSYGPQCAWHCPCGSTGHGHCSTGSYGCMCDPGWKGISCNEKCLLGQYGQECAKR